MVMQFEHHMHVFNQMQILWFELFLFLSQVARI